MTQEIIAAIIIAFAVGFAVFRIVRAFRKKNDPCNGCGSDCGGCAIADLKKEIGKKKKMTKT